jgi:hypothetical protein
MDSLYRNTLTESAQRGMSYNLNLYINRCIRHTERHWVRTMFIIVVVVNYYLFISNSKWDFYQVIVTLQENTQIHMSHNKYTCHTT